jgi:hypothetical protein
MDDLDQAPERYKFQLGVEDHQISGHMLDRDLLPWICENQRMME